MQRLGVRFSLLNRIVYHTFCYMADPAVVVLCSAIARLCYYILYYCPVRVHLFTRVNINIEVLYACNSKSIVRRGKMKDGSYCRWDFIIFIWIYWYWTINRYSWINKMFNYDTTSYIICVRLNWIIIIQTNMQHLAQREYRINNIL